MAHLINTLENCDIPVALQSAYDALAVAYLEHRAGGLGEISAATSSQLKLAVHKSESLLDLSKARSDCKWIAAESHRPAEVFDQLCHIEVILVAARLLKSMGIEASVCAPTQQSVDAAGNPIPDLGGTCWALEAYGGVNYGNNGKLAKDLKSLSKWQARSAARLFLAFRDGAWHRKTNLPSEEFADLVHTSPKQHGGPFRATAQGRVIASANGVVVAEVREVAITHTDI